MAIWSTQAATREYQIASNGELTVVERLATLLETGQFADVSIKVGEGKNAKTFKAHRLLLATASQPLSNLVSSNSNNGPSSNDATIFVNDVDPEAFRHVLKYIYTDDLELSGVGESLVLLRLGKKWGLQNLIDKTAKFLDTFLNEYEPINEDRKNELCDLTVLSEDYGLSLSAKCWEVLLRNVNEVVPCQGFLNMSKDMVRRLLNHPDFKFKNQVVLFEAIRDWGMNQVIQHNLSVNSLQGLIGEFLQFIDFKAITDVDFLDTILPSDCLGKAEIIAFFMGRGLEIPRDLAYNNNNQQDYKTPYEKTGRFKRGYKLSNQEIYKEHELRFRVDKRLRLLGVGFGFLFSNTDMGITVHCQGPWETRQWGDIIQTYCRVTWEKMKTADVRLMFSEPVVIEPNHSYKVLVRVSRMSAGSSDVDLWGGAHGNPRIKMKDAEFSFLKAAIDPHKEVEDKDTENKPGMITDLFYEIDDGSCPSSPKQLSNSSSVYENINNLSSSTTPKRFVAEIPKLYETRSHTVMDKTEDVSKSENEDIISQIGSTDASSYSFRKGPSSTVDDDEQDLPTPTPVKKKSHAEEAASYYLANRPSNIKGSDTLPAFLKSRQPSVERSKPSWQIPYRPRTSSTAYSSYKSSREPSSTRDTSDSKETSYLSRPSKISNIFGNSPLSKYNSSISSIKSKYDSNRPTSSISSRSGFESTANQSNWSSSRYGNNTISSKPEYKYGSLSKPSLYSTSSDSRYGNASETPSSRSFTRYAPTSNISRSTRESAPSPTRTTSVSSNFIRKEPEVSRPIGSSRYGTSSSLGSSSRYGLTTPGTNYSSKYGASSLRSTDKYETNTTPSNISSKLLGSSRFASSANTSDKLESSGRPTTLGSSRYSSNLSTSSSSSSIGNRYNPHTTGSQSLSSSRLRGNSPAISNYSTGISSRFNSSIYRR